MMRKLRESTQIQRPKGKKNLREKWEKLAGEAKVNKVSG